MISVFQMELSHLTSVLVYRFNSFTLGLFFSYIFLFIFFPILSTVKVDIILKFFIWFDQKVNHTVLYRHLRDGQLCFIFFLWRGRSMCERVKGSCWVWAGGVRTLSLEVKPHKRLYKYLCCKVLWQWLATLLVTIHFNLFFFLFIPLLFIVINLHIFMQFLEAV